MDVNPPYAIKAISKEPILKGSEEDDLPPLTRAACAHYKQKVIFPIGAITKTTRIYNLNNVILPDNQPMFVDSWILSVGTNDSGVSLVKIEPKDLKL